jgi:hypothetical protein
MFVGHPGYACMFNLSVIPAQAGIQPQATRQIFWIPACAGMTWM